MELVWGARQVVSWSNSLIDLYRSGYRTDTIFENKVTLHSSALCSGIFKLFSEAVWREMHIKPVKFLPWTRIPSSTNTCHIPTAWLLVCMHSFCFSSQSTSSLPEQHCLWQKFNVIIIAIWIISGETVTFKTLKKCLVPVCFEVVLPISDQSRAPLTHHTVQWSCRLYDAIWKKLNKDRRMTINVSLTDMNAKATEDWERILPK